MLGEASWRWMLAGLTRGRLFTAPERGNGRAPGDLATRPDEAVFWTREMGGHQVAEDWAVRNGGVTLEMRMVRAGIDLRAWAARDLDTALAWKAASENFAAGASGRVRVLQDRSVRVASVWAQIEYPVVMRNPSVTSIVAINPRTGVETEMWSRPATWSSSGVHQVERATRGTEPMKSACRQPEIAASG